MTNFHSLPSLGNYIASSYYGYNTDKTIQEQEQLLKYEQKVVCLLAALVSKTRSQEEKDLTTFLAGIRRDLVSFRETIKDFMAHQKRIEESGIGDESDPIANAIRNLYGKSFFDTPLDGLDTSRLSVRAKRILQKSGFVMLSHITEENLGKIKGCGNATVIELLLWVKDMQLTSSRKTKRGV
jgi:hypothetical protein